MVMICLREKLDKSELRKLVKAVDKSLIWKLSRENLNSSVWFTFDWHLIKKVSNGKIFTAFIWKWIIPIMRKRFEHRFWLWGLRSAFVFVKWAELSWVRYFYVFVFVKNVNQRDRTWHQWQWSPSGEPREVVVGERSGSESPQIPEEDIHCTNISS